MTDAGMNAIRSVMDNVNRLVEDATLLISKGRLPSAFVLDVIALEEVGKVIHIRWRQLDRKITRQARTGHLQKQWAVACLLVADKLLPFYNKIILGPPSEQPARMMELAAAFMDSPERHFFERVMEKTIDRSKQLGLYEDESNAEAGVSRSSLNQASIQEISDIILRAVVLLANDVVLVVASIFYEIMPPFKDAIVADRASRS